MAKLKKSGNKMIAGVAAGYAEYFNIDVTIMRVIFGASVFFGGLGLLIYIISLLIME